jgi:hypothetical protein
MPVDRPARTSTIVFSRAQACVFAGVTRADLARWEQAADVSLGARRGGYLSMPDLLGLCVLRELDARLGPRFGDYALGVSQLVAALETAEEVERLDSHVALVGADFARLCELRSEHVSCAGDAFISVPLHPLLAELRDRVFS